MFLALPGLARFLRCQAQCSPVGNQAGFVDVVEGGPELGAVDQPVARLEGGDDRGEVDAFLGRAAATLDGRVTVPGSRWVSGEESRRLVPQGSLVDDGKKKSSKKSKEDDKS